MSIEIIRTISSLRDRVKQRRGEGARIGVVPTMGALHDGHLALVARSRTLADVTITTLFVNPTQFAANEDLARYPRTEAADAALLEAAKCDILFAPPVEQMYPAGFVTAVHLEGPAAAGLEDRFRPGHFSGVATVVAKLFQQTAADVAVFGEKDWQQLAVVRRMARDLDMPIDIVGLPTVREPDGLAMSSRNRYLSPDERLKAPILFQAMQTVSASVRTGSPLEAALAKGRSSITAAGFDIDYFEARDGTSLAPVMDGARASSIRLLLAARLGNVRLIDNMALE